jgi:hypothetical protein
LGRVGKELGRVGKELGKSWEELGKSWERERVGKELGKSWERVGKELGQRHTRLLLEHVEHARFHSLRLHFVVLQDVAEQGVRGCERV